MVESQSPRVKKACQDVKIVEALYACHRKRGIEELERAEQAGGHSHEARARGRHAL
jgi:hypothetical protein